MLHIARNDELAEFIHMATNIGSVEEMTPSNGSIDTIDYLGDPDAPEDFADPFSPSELDDMEEMVYADVEKMLLMHSFNFIGDTAEDVAGLLETSQNTVLRWMDGQSDMGAAYRIKICAALLDIDVSDALHNKDLPAASQLVARGVAARGSCTLEHVNRLLGYKKVRRKLIRKRELLALQEMSMWTLYGYDLSRFARVDWIHRRIWKFRNARRTNFVIRSIRGLQVARPRNPIDIIGRHQSAKKLEGVVIVNKKESSLPKFDIENRRPTHSIKDLGYTEGGAQESVGVVAANADEVDGEDGEDSWDVMSKGPDPHSPFSPRPGYPRGAEMIKWKKNREEAGIA